MKAFDFPRFASGMRLPQPEADSEMCQELARRLALLRLWMGPRLFESVDESTRAVMATFCCQSSVIYSIRRSSLSSGFRNAAYAAWELPAFSRVAGSWLVTLLSSVSVAETASSRMANRWLHFVAQHGLYFALAFYYRLFAKSLSKHFPWKPASC